MLEAGTIRFGFLFKPSTLTGSPVGAHAPRPTSPTGPILCADYGVREILPLKNRRFKLYGSRG